MTTYHNLGGGYKVSDEYINQGLNVGFTKEAQKEFFKAIKNLKKNAIKKFLQEKISLISKEGETIEEGFQPKYDINGKYKGKSAIELLAKYSPKNPNAAREILRTLLNAHKLDIEHQEINADDQNKALDYAERYNPRFHM